MTDDAVEGTVSLDVYEALRDAPDVATADYLRCKVGGLTLQERADDRDVARGTVASNVSRAKEYVDA